MYSLQSKNLQENNLYRLSLNRIQCDSSYYFLFWQLPKYTLLFLEGVCLHTLTFWHHLFERADCLPLDCVCTLVLAETVSPCIGSLRHIISWDQKHGSLSGSCISAANANSDILLYVIWPQILPVLFWYPFPVLFKGDQETVHSVSNIANSCDSSLENFLGC